MQYDALAKFSLYIPIFNLILTLSKFELMSKIHISTRNFRVFNKYFYLKRTLNKSSFFIEYQISHKEWSSTK